MMIANATPFPAPPRGDTARATRSRTGGRSAANGSSRAATTSQRSARNDAASSPQSRRLPGPANATVIFSRARTTSAATMLPCSRGSDGWTRGVAGARGGFFSGADRDTMAGVLRRK
ncbi:MAG: hypothetical protein IPP94_19055 [Ignavibacteria bacterium]|nr:hypothetical protein [Ignavibacteria bacterium]